MSNIADDIHNAYFEGYEQGRFDVLMDVTDGKAACKGYDVMAVVKCKNCTHKEKAKINSKGFLICPGSGMEITDDDFCSYGERKEK